MSVTVDDVLNAVEAAQAKHGRGFELPDPLKRCTRCEAHAALFEGEREGEWICGPCAPRVSVFRLPMSPSDLRQVAADLALEVRAR